MAVKGLAGHRFSHAPHPMHLSSLTVGIRREFSSSGFFLTIRIAFAGQCLAQLPQLTPSLFTTQLSRLTTAWPICIDVFSSTVTGLMAPAGQTCEQFVHSGRQYPLSKDISGCMKFSRDVDGLRTLLGQLLTHSWHAVQCCEKFLRLIDPAGTSLVDLSGLLACSISARPPSTFTFCA